MDQFPKRKDNFASIIQHDLPLSKEMMGGGLFDSGWKLFRNQYSKGGQGDLLFASSSCSYVSIRRMDKQNAFRLITLMALPIHT